MTSIHDPRGLPGAARLTREGRRSVGGPEVWVAHGVRAAESAEPGEWLADRLRPISIDAGTQVCSVTPDGFEAYARVFHPARQDPEGKVPLRWDAVADWSGRIAHPEMQWDSITRPSATSEHRLAWKYEPDVGFCPPAVLSVLVEIVQRHTSERDHRWACVWEGWASVGDAFPEIPRLNLPGRSYMVFSVPFSALLDGILRGSGASRMGPSLWWPYDRKWCVATEVDFSWTYVGGSDSCIKEILEDRRIEALRTAPHHRGDYKSDHLNGIADSRNR